MNPGSGAPAPAGTVQGWLPLRCGLAQPAASRRRGGHQWASGDSGIFFPGVPRKRFRPLASSSSPASERGIGARQGQSRIWSTSLARRKTAIRLCFLPACVPIRRPLFVLPFCAPHGRPSRPSEQFPHFHPPPSSARSSTLQEFCPRFRPRARHQQGESAQTDWRAELGAELGSRTHGRNLRAELAGKTRRFLLRSMEAQGPIFGTACFVPAGRPGRWTWEPSDCDECWEPLRYWVNYNYRCCLGCWEIISSPLWRHLVSHAGEAPSNLIWAFLIEPGQH